MPCYTLPGVHSSPTCFSLHVPSRSPSKSMLPSLLRSMSARISSSSPFFSFSPRRVFMPSFSSSSVIFPSPSQSNFNVRGKWGLRRWWHEHVVNKERQRSRSEVTRMGGGTEEGRTASRVLGKWGGRRDWIWCVVMTILYKEKKKERNRWKKVIKRHIWPDREVQRSCLAKPFKSHLQHVITTWLHEVPCNLKTAWVCRWGSADSWGVRAEVRKTFWSDYELKMCSHFVQRADDPPPLQKFLFRSSSIASQFIIPHKWIQTTVNFWPSTAWLRILTMTHEWWKKLRTQWHKCRMQLTE